MTERNGITEVSRDKLLLTTPPDRPANGSLRYALAFPFQAGPRVAGLMVMRMIEETPNYGFLDGSDVILLDELKPPGRKQIFAATRNHVEKGNAGAPQRLFMKSPLIGGFVPLGALGANGNPHPHAGTGFGVGQAHWFPFPGGRFSWGDPERKDMNEVYQLAYDGKTFSTRRTEVRAQSAEDQLRIAATGWSILATGLSNAIPDGDDLLLAIMAVRCDFTAVGIGVLRWARRSGVWQAVDFDPVVTSEGCMPRGPNPKEQCPWIEPSLARDADGSLLVALRGADTFTGGDAAASGYRMRLWRSAKAGAWQLVLDAPQTRLNSPVTVNVAADGSAYIISNPYDPRFIPETDTIGRGRERLVLWPLNETRTGLGRAMVVRDCLAQFGAPPSIAANGETPEKWMADHPNGLTVRLKDGCWHHIMAYRICHCPRYRSYGTPPSPHSGSCIEEVISCGPARPVWSFMEEK